jgi:hypothetical protein
MSKDVARENLPEPESKSPLFTPYTKAKITISEKIKKSSGTILEIIRNITAINPTKKARV